MVDIHEGHVRDAWTHSTIDNDWDACPVMQVPIVRGPAQDFHFRASQYFSFASYRRRVDVIEGVIDGVQVWSIVGEIPGTDIKGVVVERGVIATNHP